MKAAKLMCGMAMMAMSVAVLAAPSITVQWDSPIVNPSLGSVSVTSPVGNPTANVGRFTGQVTAFSGIDAAELVLSTDDFFAYCHDLAQTITGGNTYQYTDVTFGSTEKVQDFLGAVNVYLKGDAFAWLKPLNKEQSGAIQLGIWEGLYGDDFNIDTGNVRFGGSKLTEPLRTIFDDIVSGMAGSADLDSKYVMVLKHPNSQDVITGYRPPRLQVPEPGTLALLGVATLVAGIARRRRS